MSTLIPCPTCFAWVQQKSLGRHNKQKHLRAHTSSQVSTRFSDDNYGMPVHNSWDDGGMASGDWDNGTAMVNVEDIEEERMDVDTAPPDEEEVLRYEPFVNAGICTTSAWLTIGLAVEESLELEQSESSGLEKTYWPFKNKDQWQLALWALFPTPISRPRAERAIVAKFAVWAKQGSCFESWGEFQRLIQSVEEKGGKWHRKVLHRVDTDPSWYPVEVRFWERNSLDILKELVADIKVV